MKISLKFKKLKKIKSYFLPLILFLILIVLSIFTYENFLENKYYPRTLVGNVDISFLTEGQAIEKLQNTFSQRASQKLTFSYPQGNFTIDLATSSANLDYSPLTKSLGDQSGNFWHKLQSQFKALFLTQTILPQISLNLDSQIQNIQSSISKEPVNAQLIFNETTNPQGTPSANIQIKDGANGLSLDSENLISQIKQFLLTGIFNPNLPVKLTPPKVTTSQLLLEKTALENTESQPIKLQFNEKSWTIDTKQLLTLLDTTQGSANLLDKDKTMAFLDTISSQINQDVQEGLFRFDLDSKRVTAFKPSQDGQKLDTEKTFQLLADALQNNTKVIDLPVEVIKPKTQTQDVNSLGIKDLIGRGISNFAGSIPNRAYNVELTAQKINGVLVPPGEIFSFNNTVGDISAATGYKQAYVIKEGRTVLDDGGGVCQDSTTLFRAVLNAGLPVVKRTAHAYRVGYYEQGFPPGLDATVYYPSVDFQFKNDTPNYVLIQSYTVGTTLYVDLYGTPDGRTVTLSTPVVTGQTPPPPDLRQDDPTLPKGTVKQVDFAAWGATVNFKRTVSRNGAILLSENWVSNYKPWQAVYLVGTQ